VLIAAVSKGGFGSGVGFLSTTLIALVVEPAQAVGLVLPLLMVMDATGLRSYWRRWSWPHARVLMIGMVSGVALGWLFFRVVSARHAVGGCTARQPDAGARRSRGVALGVRLHRTIPATAFFRLTYALLLATGAKLVFDA
jgi:uncharacterized membrane protein YfcA